MTRKDYIYLARALQDTRPAAYVPLSSFSYQQWLLDCGSIAATLAAENPRGFDAELFLTNCGVRS